ncbi:Protein high chlorophyll fluorescent [Porphyridium purpureum]|uniref:Protein high chlorophyll fluorescent n=1 Tax=Porphyridium purpureum TaxID=35688 RepID=A0A5J4Z7V4_PORPP|nr:Protein high chlorophyll fluorescent [Porphyridium purpureum]|eukprot:POR6817..scf295_1
MEARVRAAPCSWVRPARCRRARVAACRVGARATRGQHCRRGAAAALCHTASFPAAAAAEMLVAHPRWRRPRQLFAPSTTKRVAGRVSSSAHIVTDRRHAGTFVIRALKEDQNYPASAERDQERWTLSRAVVDEYPRVRNSMHSSGTESARAPNAGSVALQGASRETERVATKTPLFLEITTRDPADGVCEALFQEAHALEKRSRFRSAAAKYDQALRIDPSFGRCAVRRALLEVKVRDALAARPNSHENEARIQQSIERQRDVFRGALRADPRNSILWQCWADLEKSLRLHKRARTLFRVARRANPSLGSIYNSWSQMEYALGRAEFARAILLQGLRRCPENARLYYSMGVLEDRLGHTEHARKFFSRGATYECGFNTDTNNRASDADGAADQSSSRSKGDRKSVFCLQGRATLEYKAGNVAAARECLLRASQIDPQNTLVWLTWGQIEERQQQFVNARNVYRRGTEQLAGAASVSWSRSRSTSTLQVWQSWARMEHHLGNWAQAKRVFESALDVYPRDVQLVREYGKLMRIRSEVQASRNLFKRALQIDPCDPYSWQCFAVLEAEQLNFESARTLYVDGVKKCNPEHERLLAHLPAPAAGPAAASYPVFTEQESTAFLVPLELELPNDHRDDDDVFGEDHAATGKGGRMALRARPSGAKALAWGLPGAGGSRAVKSSAAAAKTRREAFAALLFSWGLLEVKCGETARARFLFKEGVNVFPDSYWMWSLFAEFEKLSKDGDLLVARNYCARAIRLNNMEPRIWECWGQIEEQLGREELARTCLERSNHLRMLQQFERTTIDSNAPLRRRRKSSRT